MVIGKGGTHPAQEEEVKYSLIFYEGGGGAIEKLHKKEVTKIFRNTIRNADEGMKINRNY